MEIFFLTSLNPIYTLDKIAKIHGVLFVNFWKWYKSLIYTKYDPQALSFRLISYSPPLRKILSFFCKWSEKIDLSQLFCELRILPKINIKRNMNNFESQQKNFFNQKHTLCVSIQHFHMRESRYYVPFLFPWKNKVCHLPNKRDMKWKSQLIAGFLRNTHPA